MEKEVVEGKLYSLIQKNDNLHFIKEFIKKNDLYLLGELEIDPFDKFSLDFSAEYWYLKYHLLRDEKILLTVEDDSILFDEKDINVVFFKVSDLENFSIECNDGNWYLRIIKLNKITLEIFKTLKADISDL